MAGSCWRLLAAVSLILVAPAFLRGQDPIDERVPVVRPNLRILRDPTLAEPRLPLSQHLPLKPTPLPGTLAFQKIVGAAGIIFSGHVTSIGHVPVPSGQAPASTNVTFKVEGAIRGVLSGQTLTIHEWAGLWASGERYRIGERVLLFLYPPGKLGLTSPVAGAMGRFAVDSQGRIVMSGQQVANLGTDPILGGKAIVPYFDFAQAIRRVRQQE